MSILVNKHTRLIVQGITGSEGAFHTERMRAYGTAIVAGVTPGKGGMNMDGIPVFDSVAEAQKRTGANASILFVPPAGAADAIMEAADAGIEVIVCITEGIPVHDMIRATAFVRKRGAVLVGPNCPGLISPGQTKVGIMPSDIHLPGRIGVVSRSGTLTYEAVDQLTRNGFGQSTCIGIGGDPIIGQTFTDILKRFDADPDTDAVVLIGEIGGARSGGIRPGPFAQASFRLHRRAYGPSGKAHGARGGHRFWTLRNIRGKECLPRSVRDHLRGRIGGDRGYGKADAQLTRG